MYRTLNPTVSLLAGRSITQMQTDLDAAQTAYIELSSGSKVESISYAQGAGSRSVTYTQADMGALQNIIRSLQKQLGITPRGRAPIRPAF